MQFVTKFPLGEALIEPLNRGEVEVLLAGLNEGLVRRREYDIAGLVNRVHSGCFIPGLFSGSSPIGAGRTIPDPDRKLTLKITPVIGRA